jgi:hypothetical protein
MGCQTTNFCYIRHTLAFPLFTSVPLLTCPHSHIAYLQVSTGLKMVLTDGAKASDVFWQVGTSATFKTGSEVVGTVMAYASIAMGTQATIQGRLFALNGAVTLIQNTIEFPFTA